MSATRAQIVATTSALMESQGFHGTGISQIIRESGAPKGSLYYYFPEGKDELAKAAIRQAGQTVAEHIITQLSADKDLGEALYSFVTTIAEHVEASEFRRGGPLLAVAMETATTNEGLNLACRDAYRLLQEAFARKFAEGGFEEQAEDLAVFTVAAIEGGVVLSRTHHSGEPLRLVARQLRQLLTR